MFMTNVRLFGSFCSKVGLALTITLLFAGGGPLFATITVSSTADAGGTCPGLDCTLRQAIVTAGPQETINFSLPSPSIITLTGGALLICKSLTIGGPGAGVLRVQRGYGNTPTFRVFTVTNVTVTISGLTISNGNTPSHAGAAISSSGTLTLRNTQISGNVGNGAGAISNSGFGTLTIINSCVSGNSSLGGCGGIYNGSNGTLTITNSTISGNNAYGGSCGGICNARTLTMTNSTI